MKKVTYFNDLKDGEINSPEEIVPLIHKNDILSISISSSNPEASAVFNAPNLLPTSSSTVIGAPSQLVGYLVNEKGDIMFPVLGNVHAEGLTTMQLSSSIAKMLTDEKQLIDPIVSTRITNFRVTVLGEVGHPGVIPVPNEQITILEALGFAGDLTIYGRRDNVLLIRETKGKKIVQHFDLNSKDILSSPIYNLKPNDVVYVEPNIDKARSVSNTRQLLPVAFAALSFLIILATLHLNKQL
ncbi:MAG TPA: polysaccharide biosynthesis/export family protein [Puia sp.]|nr:polysaccharide biosynthesis/export family protein [Puia sp.]